MTESMRMWVEISFNILYLIVVWTMVAVMWGRRGRVAPENQHSALLATAAFALLALGDSGHVGFRVWAYALGGLESRLQLGNISISLVGIGALATAITVTFFYMLALELWREHFHKPLGPVYWALIAAGLIRLVIMALPGNQWSAVVPPQPMSLIRNLPLMLQGLGLAYLILRDAAAAKDRPFTWIGVSILVSYACYTPVILWVQTMPMIGMLMIPKTLAYVAIAFIAYNHFYRSAVPGRPVAAAALR
jgi:hypothetical protein